MAATRSGCDDFLQHDADGSSGYIFAAGAFLAGILTALYLFRREA